MRSNPMRSLACLGRGLVCMIVAAFLIGGLPSLATALEGERYVLKLTRSLLVRLDSETGRVWLAAKNGDGGWHEIGSSPDLAGEPQAKGRFGIIVLKSAPARHLTLGGAGGPDSRATLILTDGSTGRAWVGRASHDTEWEAIGEDSG